jgi:hypothetical protein
MEISNDQRHFLKKNNYVEEDLLNRLKESKMQTIISVQSKGNITGSPRNIINKKIPMRWMIIKNHTAT